MPPVVKKVLTWIFWIFVVYAVITNPNSAANLVHTVWDIIISGFHNIGVFFDRILGR